MVEPGWQAAVTGRGDLLLTRVTARPDRAAIGRPRADPVMLEIFNNLFMSVAEQMGERLQSTAHSVNIKERLDFSCAIFDADGGLIANAPHMPVHLGSMGESIKMVIKRNPSHQPRRRLRAQRPLPRRHSPPRHHHPVFAPVDPRMSSPRRVIGSPEARDDIWFYVASRGHHAEIGGISPGSMPAASTRIEEEGVLIDNWLLVEDAQLREAETIELLPDRRVPVARPRPPTSPTCAPRSPPTRRASASCARMVDHFGLDVVHAYMGHVQENAAESVRRVITALHDGQYAYELDNGATINVAVRVDHKTGPPRSTSPAPRRSCQTTSTRRPAWRWPPCCTCSAPWSTTTSR